LNSGSNKNLGIKMGKTRQEYLIFDVPDYEFQYACDYYKEQKPDMTTPNYIDELFPPNERSLCYIDRSNEITKDTTDDEVESLRHCKWKRPFDIFRTQDYYLYDKVEVSDIHQGQLGNCYFLSALSALAEFPERYNDIFITKKKSQNGCYALRLILQGIPKIVTVDDYFPAITNCWFAASSGMREIWVNIMEKAWAKVSKSYASTIAGLPSESLSCLTEAPCFSIIHKKYSPEKIWDILSECDKKNYIICTNTGNNSDAEEVGLVRFHAYTIISCHDYRGELKLLKVRNPWGGFEWKGDFSDTSPKWDEIPGLKDFLGYAKTEDGIFFMTFDDFLTYFPYTFICKYKDGYEYNFKKVLQESNKAITMASFTINKPTKIVIGLHQKQQRFYSKVKGYKPQMARIILAKFSKDSDINYQFIGSDSSDSEKLYIETELLPGEYHIFSHVNWPYQTPCKYVLSTYANTLVDLEKLERESIPNNYLNQIFQSYLDSNCSPHNISDKISVQISSNDNDLGFYMVSFSNLSPKENYRIKLTCEYNENCILVTDQKVINNMKLEDGNWTRDTYSFHIGAGASQMLVWKLNSNPWHSKINLGAIEFNIDSKFTAPDPYKQLIEANIAKLKEEMINTDLFYCEMDVDDGVILIFKNKCAEELNYAVRLNFTVTNNLHPVNSKKLTFQIPPHSFEYFRMKKNDMKTQDYNFVFTYSYKKINAS
jgi:hypothetical protein